MSSDQGIETQTISVSSTNNYATFDGGIQACVLSCDVDTFVDFDQPSDAGSFYVKATEHPANIDFHGVNVKKIHAKTTGGTGTLYILGIRGS